MLTCRASYSVMMALKECREEELSVSERERPHRIDTIFCSDE